MSIFTIYVYSIVLVKSKLTYCQKVRLDSHNKSGIIIPVCMEISHF